MSDAVSSPRLIVILGPTAGGKSELAVALAELLPDVGRKLPGGGGEIIGADSMQVYRHLDAGTAKPSPELRKRVPHHLIDIVEPTQRFTVADWLERAEGLIADLLARGRWPIVVGGTNLYLKALLEGMFEGPGADADFRRELDPLPGAALHERLAAIDPAAAACIAPADRKRLVRALEVHHVTGRPISALQTQWSKKIETRNPESGTPAYRRDPILIGLDWPTDAINRRINARVKSMFHPGPPELAHGSQEPPHSSQEPPHSSQEPRHRSRERDHDAGEPAALSPIPESLASETRRLEAAGLLGPQAREALGTKQVLQYADAEGQEAMERTKILTRRFAKQQRTWLKRFRGVHWIEAEPQDLRRWTQEAMSVVMATEAAE